MKVLIKNKIGNIRKRIKSSLIAEIQVYLLLVIIPVITIISLIGYYTAKKIAVDYALYYGNELIKLRGITSIAFLLSLALITFSMRRLLKKVLGEINSITKISEEISNGNFNVDIPKSTKENEVGILINNISSMKENIENIFEGLATATKNVKIIATSVQESLTQSTMGSQNLADTTVSFSQKVDDTAKNSEEIQASIKALDSTVEEIKFMTETITTENNNAKEGIVTSEEALNSSIVAMNDVLYKSEDLEQETLLLVDAFKDVYNFVSEISYIAEQIQMLSLNAEIESAKAGEYGRTFSVVAKRMKDLAVDSKKLASNAKEVINVNSIELGKVQAIILENKDIVQNGMSSLHEGMTCFNDLTENVKNSIESTEGIIEMINISNESISSVTDSIEASTSNMITLTDEITNISALSEEQLAINEELYSSFEMVNIELDNLSEAIKINKSK